MREILDDLAAEAAALDALLDGLDDATWLKATPADGWDVRDSVAHLAMADDMAYECATTGPGPVMQQAAEILSSGGDQSQLEAAMLAKGRAKTRREVLVWWRSSNARLREALAAKRPDDRLPWGPNMMSARAFATARLMETWAHGLDCFAAAGVHPVDTDRLRHVAWISHRALGYAFVSRGLPAPGPVRLSLTLPSGAALELGPDDAPTVISGSASDWCRVATHRDRADERSRLRARGLDADAVLANVQAYL